jgi:DNA polymerase-3 subunit gamma/tau
MSQVLYLKWRPRRWEEVVGQDHVVTTIQNAVRADRVAHAYLFAGPRGTGKTTTARLLAKAVNCLAEDLADRPCDDCDHCLAVNQGRFLDLIEIDAASNTSVDDVRNLRDKINFSPNLGRFKVYIIDEVHMLSTAAFNALLKTLEEPPPHAIFILATTEVHKIPATVLSRCQRHEFRRIPVAAIVDQLRRMADEEDLDIEPEALNLLARQATGSLRDAISLLDQLASTGERITLGRAEQVLGTVTGQSVLDVITALLANQPAQGLAHIHAALDGGSDARQFARQIVDYLRSVLLVRLDNASHVDAPTEVRGQMAVHAQAFEVSQLLDVIRIFNAAAVDIRQAWQPGLPLELALVESLERLASPIAEVAAPAAAKKAKPAPAPAAAPSPAVEKPLPESVPPEVAALETEAKPGSAVTLNRISETWPQVLTIVRQRNPQTQGLLNSCKPMGFKSGNLILGFASDLIKSKMEKPEHLQLTQEILSQVLGEDVGLRCVVSATALKHRLDELGGLDNDSMVAVAVRDLGGEIVDIQ